VHSIEPLYTRSQLVSLDIALSSDIHGHRCAGWKVLASVHCSIALPVVVGDLLWSRQEDTVTSTREWSVLYHQLWSGCRHCHVWTNRYFASQPKPTRIISAVYITFLFRCVKFHRANFVVASFIRNNNVKLKVKLSHNRPWRHICLWEVEDTTSSKESAHRWRWGCQPYAPTAL
jgi:hypothetical protein